MNKGARELRRHLRDPHLRSWIQTNDEFFRANPSALHSLLDHPEMLTTLQTRMAATRNVMNRRPQRALRRTNSQNQAGATAPRRKSLFNLPKLSLPKFSLADMGHHISRAADVIDTIRNLSALFNR